MKAKIEAILAKTTDKFPQRVWIGKDYSIADLQNDLKALLTDIKNMED